MAHKIILMAASAMGASCIAAIGFYNFGGCALVHQLTIIVGSALIIGLTLKERD